MSLYNLDASHIRNPPKKLKKIFAHMGPGMITTASVVGSGELIATTTLGAEVGFTMMWFIVFSCFFKAVIQSHLGRLSIVMGRTSFGMFNFIPGKIKGVNFIVWTWGVMLIGTIILKCAMFVGISQVMVLFFPSTDLIIWLLLFVCLTIFILLKGGYATIEKVSVLMVFIFTLLTVFSAILMINMPNYFSWSEIKGGLTFSFPDSGIITAIAVFGITGVGAYEMYSYPVWCIEKGYARFTGKNDGSADWEKRAKGWVKVMNFDVFFSMIIYTLATIAFYLLGAGILNTYGLIPKGDEMIQVLSNIYTETLGSWSSSVFFIGAITVLYSTIFASTASASRMFSDFLSIAGIFRYDDDIKRKFWRDFYVVFSITISFVIYFILGESPVFMVKIGGTAQAWMIPVICLGTLYCCEKFLIGKLKLKFTTSLIFLLSIISICFFVLTGELKRFTLS